MAASQRRVQDELRDPEGAARAICLRLLALQPRTRSQLAAALAGRGVPADVAAAVLGRFTEVGLIDDAAFASAWVQSRHTGRGLARRALRSELQRRGVDDETAATALDLVDPETELATAHALVSRRLASTRGLPPQVRLRRLAGLLARKGYGPAVALGVVREALAGESPPSASLSAGGTYTDELLDSVQENGFS